MTDFNPLAGAILGSAQAQHQVNLTKQRQLRRSQTLRKNVASADEELEHHVESSEELTSIHDEEKQHSGGQQDHPRRPPKEEPDEPPHLDLKA
jgi:hypothetical protein